MNIIRMTGGLGNQMFEYALFLKYKAIGIESEIEDFSEYENRDNARPINLERAFGIEYPRASREDYYSITDSNPSFFSKVRRKLCGSKAKVYYEASSNFDPEILKKDNSYICGYFQTDKYFSDIKEEIIREFSFKSEVEAAGEEILRQSLGESYEAFDSFENVMKNAVGIHIRRGDYLLNEANYGNICTEEYYDNAVRYYKENAGTLFEGEPVFLCFSNDAEWTSKWMEKYVSEGFRMFNVTGTTEDNGYIDMYLMSKCAHNIIANSSFSWWAAYLNRNPEKKVIAPSKWANHIEQKDIYTDYMIVL